MENLYPERSLATTLPNVKGVLNLLPNHVNKQLQYLRTEGKTELEAAFLKV